MYSRRRMMKNANNKPNTLILLHFEGNINNESEEIAISQIGSATIRYWAYLFSQAISARNSGESNAVKLTGNPTSVIRSALNKGNYTLEFFLYCSSSSGNPNQISINLPNGASLIFNGTTMTFASGNTITATIPRINTSPHIAISVKNNHAMIFINGVLTAEGDILPAQGEGDLLIYIGRDSSYTPYMDEFRLSRIPRYTENFAKPTAPFELD